MDGDNQNWDFDEILRQEDAARCEAAARRERNARMMARFAPLWAEAEEAIRTDVGTAVELAEYVGATLRGERSVLPAGALQARRMREERARGDYSDEMTR